MSGKKRFLRNNIRLPKYAFVLFFFGVTAADAFELADELISIEEVLPLFNVHEKSFFVSRDEKKINPKKINVPDKVNLGEISQMISVEGFIGETIFKDIVLKTTNKNFDVEIKIQDMKDKGIRITPRLVTNWYQAGSSTARSKTGGQLTYELLLSDDRYPLADDKWVKSKKGGWIYIPPEIKLSETLNTSLRSDSYKRILLKISLSEGVRPDLYKTNLEIITYQGENKLSLMVPVVIDVKPVKLSVDIHNKYKLLLYTAFKLGDQIERHGAYVNAMRLQGGDKKREDLFLSYLEDISAHGFNGITIRDWDVVNLEKTLELVNKANLKYIVLHATTPISKKNRNSSIVNNKVKDAYDKYNTELYFYGYDERGGNKSLKKQLKLNKEIHGIGGKSVNAIFWDDMDAVIEATDEKSECFDIIAYSMGSHGNKEMYNSLPYKVRDDFCSKQGTEYLVYWHPQVENPVINRIFTGFWLWASGFDGIIPHGYYFPSHIEKFLTEEDLKNGLSRVTSPYDDWAAWLPGKKPLRHHNSVYPSVDGPIGTLQWEGVLSGMMDLKYIVTLEKKLDEPGIDKVYRGKILTLLGNIRRDVLQISSPYMSDKKSIAYLKKLELWKKEISRLLLN